MLYSANMDEATIEAIDAEEGTLRWRGEINLDQHSCRITSVPKLEHKILYVPVESQQDGEYDASSSAIYAIDLQTGQTLQSFPLSSLQSTASIDHLTVYNGIAYLSVNDRDISNPHVLCQAIDLQTTADVWVTDLGKQEGISVPLIAHDTIYLVTRDFDSDHQCFGHLHALNARTGEKIWHYTFKTIWTDKIPVAVVDTDIFVVSSTLEVLDATTGEKRWSLPGLNVSLQGTPLVSDDLVCISYERTLDTRKLELKKPHEVLLASRSLYIGGVLAVDRASQELRWMMEELTRGYSHINTAGAVIADGILYTTWNHHHIRSTLMHSIRIQGKNTGALRLIASLLLSLQTAKPSSREVNTKIILSLRSTRVYPKGAKYDYIYTTIKGKANPISLRNPVDRKSAQLYERPSRLYRATSSSR